MKETFTENIKEGEENIPERMGCKETISGECSEKFRKLGFPNVQYLKP